MTPQEAEAFLTEHQPLPPDAELSEGLIERFDEVRQYLLLTPNDRAVPLLLNAFGDGSGFGVYQLVEDVLSMIPKERVVPHIARALSSPHRGVRYWNAQIAARFPDAVLVPPLSDLARDSDFDLRYAAITALEQILSGDATAALSATLRDETDPELQALLRDVLRERGAV